MRIGARFAFLIALFLSPPPASAWQQALPPQPGKGQAICVAVVADASAKSAFVERMTERLTKSLKDNKLKALMMDSATTPRRKLEPTAENGEESRQKECDYILLTQILDPQAHPLEPQMPTISIGGRVPSIDASDPLGGSSGPVYRDKSKNWLCTISHRAVEAGFGYLHSGTSVWKCFGQPCASDGSRGQPRQSRGQN